MTEPDQKSNHWNHVYSTKESNEVSWTQEIPSTSLNFFKQSNLSKDAKIIDVGAGDSKFVDFLIADGYQNITLLDISEMAIQKTKNRLGKNADKIRWIVSDITKAELDEGYDFWHDRATFHFLTKIEEVNTYLQKVNKSLKVKGVLAMGTFSENGPTKCSGLEIKQYSESELSATLDSNFKKLKCINEDHITPFNTNQNFLFCSFEKVS